MAETLNNVEVWWGTAHLYHCATGSLDNNILTLSHPQEKTKLASSSVSDFTSGRLKLTVKATQTVQFQRARAGTDATHLGRQTNAVTPSGGTHAANWEHSMKVHSFSGNVLKLEKV